MRILGVDPGINGGCALYCAGSTVPTVPGGIFDIPTAGSGKQREIDYAGLRDLVWAVGPDIAFVEMINAFRPPPKDGEEAPSWGATSMLKLGGAFYAAKAVLACLNIPVRTLNAGEWKAGFGLQGGKAKKDGSRQLVLQRYPALAPFVNRVKDGHRAEAFLIAVYGARKLRREGEDVAIPE